MKLLITVMLLSLGTLAQTTPGKSERLQSSCGPLNETFEVRTSKNEQTSSAETNKALVIIIEQFDKNPGEFGRPTLRIGLDGSWVGATRDNSYFPFSVDPGERHLCLQWQSRFSRLNETAAFAQLNAEAGKTYYYRVDVKYPPKSGGSNMRLQLAPIEQAEGEYLTKINPISIAKKKE